jgi:hypothetical protein
VTLFVSTNTVGVVVTLAPKYMSSYFTLRHFGVDDGKSLQIPAFPLAAAVTLIDDI